MNGRVWLSIRFLALTVGLVSAPTLLLAQSGVDPLPPWSAGGHLTGLPRKPSSATLSLRGLQKAIGRIINQPRFATTRWGILIESLDRKRVLFSREARHLFIPASNAKLFTSAAALDYLGPDYRFRTSVLAAVQPDDEGVIDGDLILYGRGDPNLSSRAASGGPFTTLNNLAERLYHAGVREVCGTVIGDESYFSDPPLGVGWEWDDLQWYYGAEISALSVDDNVIEVTILPGEAPGDAAEILMLPETAAIKVKNKTLTVPIGGKQDIGIYRGLGGNGVEIWGQVPMDGQGFHGYVAIHQPALHAANLFSQALRRLGIKLTGRVAAADARTRRGHPLDLSQLHELAFVESIPLSQELRILNKISQNLHAELLLRALGAVVARNGTARGGIMLVRRWLQSMRARRRGITLADGSGLSRQNLVAPATIVDLLRHMYRHPQRDVFLSSLPVAGIDGTLEQRMVRTAAQANLRAKTGTLKHASALSGYLTTAGGEHVVFSIMANTHTGPLSDVVDAINKICVQLAQFGR